MPTATRLKGEHIADPSERIKREGKQMREELHRMEYEHRAPVSTRDPDTGQIIKGPGSQFPAKLTAYDPDDERIHMKINAPEALGMKMLEEKDIQHMQRLADQMTFAEFEQFAEQYFDMTNPAIARMVESIMPEFFQRREDEINQNADLQKRIALLRLYGVRSKDDIFLEFAIRSGKLPVPTAPIWNPKQEAKEKDAENYARGLFNPKRYTAAPARSERRWDPMYKAPKTGTIAANRGVFSGFAGIGNEADTPHLMYAVNKKNGFLTNYQNPAPAGAAAGGAAAGKPGGLLSFLGDWSGEPDDDPNNA